MWNMSLTCLSKSQIIIKYIEQDKIIFSGGDNKHTWAGGSHGYQRIKALNKINM